MTTYAGIRSGWVVELFTPLPEWDAIPVEQMFAKALFDEWVKIDGVDPPPAYGWAYADGKFTPPGDEDRARMRRDMAAWQQSLARV